MWTNPLPIKKSWFSTQDLYSISFWVVAMKGLIETPGYKPDKWVNMVMRVSFFLSFNAQLLPSNTTPLIAGHTRNVSMFLPHSSVLHSNRKLIFVWQLSFLFLCDTSLCYTNTVSGSAHYLPDTYKHKAQDGCSEVCNWTIFLQNMNCLSLCRISKVFCWHWSEGLDITCRVCNTGWIEENAW